MTHLLTTRPHVTFYYKKPYFLRVVFALNFEIDFKSNSFLVHILHVPNLGLKHDFFISQSFKKQKVHVSTSDRKVSVSAETETECSVFF